MVRVDAKRHLVTRPSPKRLTSAAGEVEHRDRGSGRGRRPCPGRARPSAKSGTRTRAPADGQKRTLSPLRQRAIAFGGFADAHRSLRAPPSWCADQIARTGQCEINEPQRRLQDELGCRLPPPSSRGKRDGAERSVERLGDRPFEPRGFGDEGHIRQAVESRAGRPETADP